MRSADDKTARHTEESVRLAREAIGFLMRDMREIDDAFICGRMTRDEARTRVQALMRKFLSGLTQIIERQLVRDAIEELLWKEGR